MGRIKTDLRACHLVARLSQQPDQRRRKQGAGQITIQVFTTAVYFHVFEAAETRPGTIEKRSRDKIYRTKETGQLI
jgi:hypothetical protein